MTAFIAAGIGLVVVIASVYCIGLYVAAKVDEYRGHFDV